MREDQFRKLQAMSEKLTDVVLVEMDPDNWPGAGALPKDLSQEQRGNRYWSKKNAAATLTLVMRINAMVVYAQQNHTDLPSSPAATDEDEFDIDKDIAKLEREASKRVDQVAQQRQKREFDRRALGGHAT